MDDRLFLIEEQPRGLWTRDADEKYASETLVLGRDPNRWIEEILSKLLSDHPYLNDYNLDPIIDRQAPDMGLLFGRFAVKQRVPYVVAGQQVPSVIIPVIVEGWRLKPLDIFGVDGTWLPLTRERLLSAFDSQQQIGAPVKLPDAREQAMIGMLPSAAGGVQQLPQSFSGGKYASMLSAIAETVEPVQIDVFEKAAAETGLLHKALTSEPVRQAIERIGSWDRTDYSGRMDKIASDIEPTVMQLRILKSPDGSFKYVVKSASSMAYTPTTMELTGMEFSRLPNEAKEAALRFGYVTYVSEAPEVGDDIEGLDELSKCACACDVFVMGMGRQAGVVLPVYSPVSNEQSTLFVNERGFAIQEKVAGVKTSDVTLSDTGYEPRGRGVFVTVRNGSPVAIGPVNILGSTTFSQSGEVKYAAVLDGVAKADIYLLDGLREGYMSSLKDGVLVLPKCAVFLPLPEHRLQVESDCKLVKSALHSQLNRVSVTGDHTGSWTLRGDPLSGVPSFEKESVDRAQAAFVLGAVGISAVAAEDVLDKAAGGNTVTVSVPFDIQSMSDIEKWAEAVSQQIIEAFNTIRRPDLYELIKSAAVVDNPQSLDSLLALGFLNPQNVQVFIDYIPVLEDSLQRLCALLFASRIGFRTDEQQLRFCVEALDNVIQDLKFIAGGTLSPVKDVTQPEPGTELITPGAAVEQPPQPQPVATQPATPVLQ